MGYNNKNAGILLGGNGRITPVRMDVGCAIIPPKGQTMATTEEKRTERAPRLTTLCYLEKDGRYLVLHRTKKEHDENGGKWIGVGGKFEYGESPEECARREVKEETGLTMQAPRFRGLVTFVSDEWGVEYMHLFTCTAFSGDLTECDEGDLVWLPKAELLGKKMWAGDRLFLRALDERTDFFTLKLRYEGERLVEAKFGA